MIPYFYSQFFYFVSLVFVSVHFSYENILIKWSLKSFALFNLAVIVYLGILYSINKNKSIVSFIYFVFIFCPTTILCLDREDFPNIVAMLLIFPVVFFVVDNLKVRITNRHAIKVNDETFVRFSCFIALLMILVDLDASLLTNINKIYANRHEVLESSVFHSVSILTTKVLLPISLVISIHLRSRLFVVTIYILFVLLFATYTHRSYLVYPFIIHAFAYFSFRGYDASKMLYIILGGFFTLLVLTFELTEDLYLSSMVFRRGLYIPSILTLEYYNYFLENGFYLWNNSIFSALDASDYTLPISVIIANERGLESGSNTGFVGSGFAQAGYLGVFIYSLIFSLIAKFIADANYANCNGVYTIALIPILFSAIVNSDLLITIGTHGLLYYLMFVVMIKVEKKSNPTR